MESVLESIIDGLNSWMEKILDVEERLKKTKDIRQSILDSLNRQVLDGLISDQDSIELIYICNLWLNLYNSCLYKSVDADFTDRDVLTYLLELYTLKQITKEFYINTFLQLCQSAN